MLKHSFDELKLRHLLGKLFAISLVGESDVGTIVGKDSPFGDSWMSGITSYIAQSESLRTFNDSISKYYEAIGVISEAPIYDGIEEDFSGREVLS